MVDSICATCGEKLEQAWHGELCYGCHLDALIPGDYHIAEQYAYDPDFGQINATAHPPTGVEILDSTPLRLSRVVIPKNAKMPSF